MFDLYAKYKRNEARVQEGAPMIIGQTADGEDVIIYVARIHSSNAQFKAYVENLRRTNKRKLDTATPDEQNEIYTKFAEDAAEATCVKGWTANMQDMDGNLIAYSPEAVHKIRTDLPELFTAIMDFGADASNYVGSFDENEAVKNS